MSNSQYKDKPAISSAEGVATDLANATARDELYREQQPVDRFSFNAQVADVFADMIQRSVPGYASSIELMANIAVTHVEKGSCIYDLGCSLGASSTAVYQQLAAQTSLQWGDIQFVMIDNSKVMLDKCEAVVARTMPQATVVLRCEDIRDSDINNASVVMINYTLQFLPIEQRGELLRRIHRGMKQGAALMISEKICFDDPAKQALYEEYHHQFKRNNGYSELEISQKRAAIEDYLCPETIDAHQQRLHKCGFEEVSVCFQALNFAGLLAIK